MPVVDLISRRLERLEKAQRETHERLTRLEDALARVADVLDMHSRLFERMDAALTSISDPVGRLTTAITRGRTQDLVRVQHLERRLRALERRGGRPPQNGR